MSPPPLSNIAEGKRIARRLPLKLQRMLRCRTAALIGPQLWSLMSSLGRKRTLDPILAYGPVSGGDFRRSTQLFILEEKME